MFLIGSNYPASWCCFSEFFEQTTTMAEISFDAPALLDDIREQLRRLKTSLMLLEEVAQTSDHPVLFAAYGDFLSESVESVKAGSRALCDNIDRVEEIMEPSSVPEVSPMFQEAFVPPPPPAPSPPLPSQYTLHTREPCHDSSDLVFCADDNPFAKPQVRHAVDVQHERRSCAASSTDTMPVRLTEVSERELGDRHRRMREKSAADLSEIRASMMHDYYNRNPSFLVRSCSFLFFAKLGIS